MKIAIAQINYHIGNFEYNTKAIIQSIEKAKKAQADLVVFAELSVCGYPPRDFLEFSDFIEQCQNSLKIIANSCIGIAAIVGSPIINNAPKGKPLFNAAVLLENGEIKSRSYKTLLPNYDVFDEYRYFEANTVFEVISYKNKKIALTICEDLWNVSDVPLYVVNPMDELIGQQVDIMINIAASPFDYKQAESRKDILVKNCLTYELPLIYVNHVGAQTELLFDGGSMVINSKGEIIYELKYFDEDFYIVNTDDIKNKVNAITTQNIDKTERIYKALAMGIKDYFHKMGFSKAILGLSGGIDSAVTLVLAAEALGKENVKAVLLPSQYSTQHSIDDAVKLAENIGCPYETISIENVYNEVLDTLSEQFKDLPFNVAEENIQARARAVILMALSNKFGYILLNTSNKSEAAVGYGTLYGDMCGGLSVLGDVYKTEVYELANFINDGKEIIPINSITKPPSAELRHEQKDSDSLPDYNILDEILEQYIEQRKSPAQLIAQGFDELLIKRIMKLVNTNEYKRHQTPPILRVSPKAFGMGRRMPIVGKYLS